tara:strand:- start:159 stop:434 length:276 start_codon:yes stop_codon:yes gene_type:complete
VGLGYNCKPMNPDTWANRIKRLCKEANIDRYTLHEIRHTMVSLLNNKNVDVLTISKRVGHSNVGFTLNQYGHLYNGAQEVATKKLNEILPE